MNPYQRIRSDDFDDCSQNERDDITDVVQIEQHRVVKFGSCSAGCDPGNIVKAWSCAMAANARMAGFTTGMKPVCKWTRLPCPRNELGSIVERFRGLGNRRKDGE